MIRGIEIIGLLFIYEIYVFKLEKNLTLQSDINRVSLNEIILQ
jgi:hypothetical protein